MGADPYEPLLITNDIGHGDRWKSISRFNLIEVEDWKKSPLSMEGQGSNQKGCNNAQDDIASAQIALPPRHPAKERESL